MTPREIVLAKIEGERRQQERLFTKDHDAELTDMDWMKITNKYFSRAVNNAAAGKYDPRTITKLIAVLVAWQENRQEGKE